MESYNIITSKIQALKEAYPFLRSKSDDYAFTALCIKSNFYKNPSLSLTEYDLNTCIVDGVRDGGVDALLTDPNSETSNLIICQSKHYETITFDGVRDAISKMILFYKAMQRGEYETVNIRVQKRFMLLNAEVGDESKVCFVFYTSAPKSGIREDRIQKLLQEYDLDTSNFEIQLYFADDIIDEIKESESRRPTVETGKITIDAANNALYYNDEAIIVNVSAFSIKELYATHSTNLLSRNLRYFIKKRDIDTSINDTINTAPQTFWFKNNGITIICDDFDIDGIYVKLKNFSIVNGGQTTSLLHKSKEINKDHDFYLPCKIIKTLGETEDDKNAFSLEIAKATNSQKAIKQIDLKANAPEQVRFGYQMRNVGIYYQTKRGETIPKDYKEEYKNTDLVEIGKLALAGIFQLPGASRSKPSTLYLEKYYNPIFAGDQIQICSLMEELLYIDTYFRKTFINQFDKAKSNSPNASGLIPFAHNARTICIAFVVFAARYFYKNLKSIDVKVIFDNVGKEKAYDDYYYEIFKDLKNVSYILPKKLFKEKDKYDAVLYKLFETIISSGYRCFCSKKASDSTLVESNFLKRDMNYFSILQQNWDDIIETKINDIFNAIS